MRSIVRRISHQWRYWTWRRRNPHAAFHEYYVDEVNRVLDGGGPHFTLGTRQVDSDWFNGSAARQLQFMQAWGLVPTHRCIDYGCGSLRLGRQLIAYLNRGHYMGMDVTDRFYREGIATIDEQVISAGQPQFEVIDEAGLATGRSFCPDFIVSTGVLMHVPPAEINGFLANLLSLCHEDTQALITFRHMNAEKQIAPLSWCYPEKWLVEQVEQLGGTAASLRDEKSERFDVENGGGGHGDYRVLQLAVTG